MRSNVTGRKAQYWFDSLSELGQYIVDTKPTWSIKSSRKVGSSKSWDLGASYDDAVNMARNGWLEGAAKAQEALKAFQPMTPAPLTRNDFYGHMAHVPRFCAGAPDSMIRHTPQPREGYGKVITLVVPVNATADVSAQAMANFGLGVAQYINQLENDRVRVEVIGAIVSVVSGWRVSHCWKVKGADQPLDLAVLAFTIGHPAMFRRLGFALRERCAAPQDWDYGQSKRATVADVINCPLNAFVLNGMTEADRHAKTPESALEYISGEIDTATQEQGK